MVQQNSGVERVDGWGVSSWLLPASICSPSTSHPSCVVLLLFLHQKIPGKDEHMRQSFSSVQSLSHVRLFVILWTAACQASLSITNSQNLLKLMSISSSVIPFSFRFQSFPASGSFQMSRFFSSGGQSVGVSASTSVLPKNIQD